MEYSFSASLWRWSARTDAWFFVALPPELADEIDAVAGVKAGFGSVPVTASVGLTRWQTSIFPDAGRGTFVLPVKKAVRTARGVGEGDTLTVTLELRT